MPNVIGMEHCDDPDTPPSTAPTKKRSRRKVKAAVLLKKSDHQLYEIWNEYTAESVFFTSRPTWDELLEVVKREWWPMTEGGLCASTPEEYIKKWILVEPLRHVYASQFSW